MIIAKNRYPAPATAGAAPPKNLGAREAGVLYMPRHLARFSAVIFGHSPIQICMFFVSFAFLWPSRRTYWKPHVKIPFRSKTVRLWKWPFFDVGPVLLLLLLLRPTRLPNFSPTSNCPILTNDSFLESSWSGPLYVLVFILNFEFLFFFFPWT